MLNIQAVRSLDDRLSPDYLEFHGALPIDVVEGKLTIATWLTEVDPTVLEELHTRFDAEPVLVSGDESEIRAAIRSVYGGEATTAEALLEGLKEQEIGLGPSGADVAIDDLMVQVNEAPVVRLVHLLITDALEVGASDIHLEETSAGLSGRYRVDGVLHDISATPRHLASAVVSRLKVMARLDIAERRRPQDGRIQLRLKDRTVDARVSTLPLLNGEGVVVRLLDGRQRPPGLDSLGMPAEIQRGFAHAISQPSGLVLVTGPTGSGKTTTLYSALQAIQTGREKIVTVEDPVEYELAGVAQVPVNPKVGLTFASALRSLLRQDPDVVLVGEIRDSETAEIATHAALTGHLVLSTLHTNDAPTAIARLEDLGVPSFMVASTLRGVLAQRLVRQICARCAPSSHSTSSPPEEHRGDRVCSGCRGLGYRRRTGVFEFMSVDGTVQACVRGKERGDALAAACRRAGYHPMSEQGEALVRSGVTDWAEFHRVVGGGE